MRVNYTEVGRMSPPPWIKVINADFRGWVDRWSKSREQHPYHESVDLIMTSPPYKAEDGWTEALMFDLGQLASSLLKPGGRMFVNLGQLSIRRKKNVTEPGFDMPFLSQREIKMGGTGLVTQQTICWVKSAAWPTDLEKFEKIIERYESGDYEHPQTLLEETLTELKKSLVDYPCEHRQTGHYQPLMSNTILNYCWEFLLHFAKPPLRPLDRLSIGCGYTDKTNLRRATRGKHGDIHCAGDVWVVPYKTKGRTIKKAHPYEFPSELVSKCLKVANLEPRSLVMDPFCGSGTVLHAAREMGHNSLGIERDEETARGTQMRFLT